MSHSVCATDGHLYRHFTLRGEPVLLCAHCGLVASVEGGDDE